MEQQHGFIHDMLDVEGKRAPVRIAKVDGVRARARSGAHALERIGGVGFEPVEEVLGVEDDFAPPRLQIRDGVGNHPDVFLERGFQRTFDLGIPRLPDNCHDGRFAVEQIGKPGIVPCGNALLACCPECRYARMRERMLAQLAEERDVFRVGGGKPSLNDIDAELVEATRYEQLVLEGQDYAFGLLAIVGGKMVVEGIRNEEEENAAKYKQLNVGTFFLLGVATSIDGLAVGIGLGLDNPLRTVLWVVALVGAVTFMVSMLGIYLGKRNIPVPERTANIIAGVVLIGLGAKILIEHLYFT